MPGAALGSLGTDTVTETQCRALRLRKGASQRLGVHELAEKREVKETKTLGDGREIADCNGKIVFSRGKGKHSYKQDFLLWIKGYRAGKTLWRECTFRPT